jgi:hypothetical protein
VTTAFGGTVRDEHPPADLPVSRSARLLRATRVLVGRDGLRGRRAYSGREQYFNGRDETVWDELAHPELVVHGVHLLRGAAEAKAFYARLHAAFPDWHATTAARSVDSARHATRAGGRGPGSDRLARWTGTTCGLRQARKSMHVESGQYGSS